MKSLTKPIPNRIATFFRWIAAWGVIVFFIAQLIIAIPVFLNALQPVWEHPNWSYEDKMRIYWGPYVDLMQFIQRQTPSNSVLLADPYYGSVDIYFLFPRTIIYGGADTLRSHPEIQYVVIDDRGYPDFPVPGDKIMLNDKIGLYRIHR
jgi:hypothetical protein